MYVNMKKILADAKQGGYAVGAFNIVNYLTAKAAIQAADEMSSPIIMQTSVSTVKAFEPEKLIKMLKPLAEDAAVPVAIHLDHCTDPELIIRCLDLGWSSVMIDMSKAPFETNVETTKRIVDYARKYDATTEGELGAIFGVEDDIKVDTREASLADPDDSLVYCQKTGISAFAPAIGTAHGLYTGVPKVDFARFEKIAHSMDIPMVVHGGTDLSTETFKRLIKIGAAKINISTAIKIAYCQGMYEYTKTHETENNPLKLDHFVLINTVQCVKDHIGIFGSAGRA